MKSAVLGNEDFALSDLLTSEFDLQYASRNFKFGLVPKVSSELVASSVHEFLAHDEKTYKMWTDALATVVRFVLVTLLLPNVLLVLLTVAVIIVQGVRRDRLVPICGADHSLRLCGRRAGRAGCQPFCLDMFIPLYDVCM